MDTGATNDTTTRFDRSRLVKSIGRLNADAEASHYTSIRCYGGNVECPRGRAGSRASVYSCSLATFIVRAIILVFEYLATCSHTALSTMAIL